MTKTTRPMTPEAAKTLSALDADGVWVVGGALRDALVGESPDDFDIDLAVADAEEWTRRAAQVLGAPAVKLSARFDAWRIPLPDGQIDVWNLPDGDIERDLRRRDFTVNAMAVPLGEFRRGQFAGSLIDPHGGRTDAAARMLRLVTGDALQDDPLRMLRAFRLEAEGGWRPDAELFAAIRRDAALIDRAAAERQWDELRRIFESDRLPWALRRLEQSGLLDRLFPELALGREVDQRPVHRRDVFWHQFDAVRWLVALTAHLPPRATRAAAIRRELEPLVLMPEVRSALDSWRVPLRLATLLHDIGKPETRTVDEDGSTRFFGHSELGAELAAGRLRSLRAPNRIVEQVGLLIEQHLRPGQVNSPGKPPTDRALFRFHRALGEAIVPLCWLFLADSLATAGPAALLPRWPAYAAHVGRIVAWQPQERVSSGVILDGHEIMAATGLAPGPLVGEIRAKIDEAAALGEVASVDQAKLLARALADALQDSAVAQARRAPRSMTP